MQEVAEQIFERFCIEHRLPICKIIYRKKSQRRLADYLTIIQDSCIIAEVKEKQVKSCSSDQCGVCNEYPVCNARADREFEQAEFGHVTMMNNKPDNGGLAFKERLEDASEQIANTIIDLKEEGIDVFDDIFFMLVVYNRVNIADYFTDHEVTWGLLRLLGTLNNNTDKRNSLKNISVFAILPDGIGPKKLKIYYNPISNVHINPTVFAGLPVEIYVLVQDPRRNNKYTFSFDWISIDNLLRRAPASETSLLQIVDENAINYCLYNK